ncbi:MAG: PaaI family thioesterase [Deltaproteobacteria bacterium]|nr:PaaI family thioesterase [Deltaproteobacteria bacterium]
MEEEQIHARLAERTRQEPFARLLDMKVEEVGKGYSRVEMRFTREMENLFGMAHGGAIYSLIDEAFQTAVNSHGTLAVALNMNVTYVNSPEPGDILRAEAREVSLTRKTGTYAIRVTDGKDRLIALCQALAYRKGEPLPFQ